MTRAPMTRAHLRPAVFFDRDGVLNVDIGYLHRARDVRWIDGAREAVAMVNAAGWFAFVVTNQAGVGRGYYREADVHALHDWMAGDLAGAGARIDAFEYCPHHPEAALGHYRRVCGCRKPAAGMIEALMARFPVDRSRSFLVGDKDSDVAAAAAAGIAGHLFPGGNLKTFIEPLMRRTPCASLVSSAGNGPAGNGEAAGRHGTS
ncbi:MAG TPA: HAD family hydrolase [Arenibaculum sp.]|nr:HAD family hydrolase [Arenibaculum sp.]